MRLALERRAERSMVMAFASPLVAVALTLATGAALFALLGKPPLEALKIYFLDPLRDPWVLHAMLVLGAIGGALYALIPALLKVRFGASEILTSLMLVYVAELLLDYLVREPWRDP